MWLTGVQLIDNQDRHTVLLVANDFDTMEVLEQTFGRAGFRLLMAANLEQAVSAVQTAMPDIVVCDTKVAGINRQNLQEQIPDSLELNSLPFIHLHSTGPAQEQSRYLDLDQYLSKPFDPIALASLAERTLAYRASLSNSDESSQGFASTDRRALQKEVSREIQRIRRYGGHMSLCMLDIAGQPSQKILGAPVPGPLVFDRVAEIVPDLIRSVDFIIRLSRRQLMWIMPATDASGAKLAVRRLMEAFAKVPLVQMHPSLSILVGLATAPDDGLDYDELVELAKQDLAERPIESSSAKSARGHSQLVRRCRL